MNGDELSNVFNWWAYFEADLPFKPHIFLWFYCKFSLDSVLKNHLGRSMAKYYEYVYYSYLLLKFNWIIVLGLVLKFFQKISSKKFQNSSIFEIFCWNFHAFFENFIKKFQKTNTLLQTIIHFVENIYENCIKITYRFIQYQNDWFR